MRCAVLELWGVLILGKHLGVIVLTCKDQYYVFIVLVIESVNI